MANDPQLKVKRLTRGRNYNFIISHDGLVAYATRDIATGEEMFLDYNYNEVE
jgi:SET domain-containing protein